MKTVAMIILTSEGLLSLRKLGNTLPKGARVLGPAYMESSVNQAMSTLDTINENSQAVYDYSDVRADYQFAIIAMSRCLATLSPDALETSCVRALLLYKESMQKVVHVDADAWFSYTAEVERAKQTAAYTPSALPVLETVF